MEGPAAGSAIFLRGIVKNELKRLINVETFLSIRIFHLNAARGLVNERLLGRRDVIREQ